MANMAENFPVIFSDLRSGQTGSTAEEVAARLRDMIHNRELVAGDRLPPERDLAKMLGVSRPTLRAGIRSLSAVGILLSKQGAGTFVAGADKTPILDSLPLRMLASLHGMTQHEMLEARVALEMGLAELAAERATRDEISSLSDELEGLYASVQDPAQATVHCLRFHQIIAAASGNRVLAALANMLGVIVSEGDPKTAQDRRALENSAERLGDIFAAIQHRNPEAARSAVRKHRESEV